MYIYHFFLQTGSDSQTTKIIFLCMLMRTLVEMDERRKAIGDFYKSQGVKVVKEVKLKIISR